MPPKKRAKVLRVRGKKAASSSGGPATSPPPHSAEEPIEDRPVASSSDEVTETSGAGKKASKSKVFTDLSRDQEEEMVEWLEANTVIYDRKLAAYKDSQKKALLWKEKAETMEKTGKFKKK